MQVCSITNTSSGPPSVVVTAVAQQVGPPSSTSTGGRRLMRSAPGGEAGVGGGAAEGQRFAVGGRRLQAPAGAAVVYVLFYFDFSTVGAPIHLCASLPACCLLLMQRPYVQA